MSIYTELRDAGVHLNYHQSDLYAKDCPEARTILRQYGSRRNVSAFHSEQDGELWYDIPFAFDPF